MLFDTDVVIWALRGNETAGGKLDGAPDLHLSAVSYMELLKGARDKDEQKTIKSFINDLGFEMLPVSSAVSHRAVIYMEGFALSSGLDIADAMIAASAAEHKLTLCTANDRHYRAIPSLELEVFRP